MAKNQIRLKLDGIVPLELYSKAMQNLSALVFNLSSEIVGDNVVQWTVTDLKVGSAEIWTTGYAENEIDVQKVVVATNIVTRSLIRHEVIPYSQDVIEAAIGLTSILNGKISALHVQSGDESQVDIYQPIVQPKDDFRRELGVIRGVAKAISEKPIKIVLIDELFERKVNCYLPDNLAEIARNIWRNHIEVTGLIKRDPKSGRPIDIREVSNVDLINPVEGGFLSAIGALNWEEGDELPEIQIRRVRDGV